MEVCPNLQGVQVDDPVLENEFVAQGEQVDAWAPAYCPAKQVVHGDVDPADDEEPGIQALQVALSTPKPEPLHE